MDDAFEILPTIMPLALTGSVIRTEGMATDVGGLAAPIGAVVEIERQVGPPVRAEVIGFRNQTTIVYPLGDISGVRHGSRVRLLRTGRWVRAGQRLLGRVVDANLDPIDGRGAVGNLTRIALHRQPPNPIERPRIETPLSTGIRALDTMLTTGRGQRIGIFAGSGVGKSILLGMMARYTSADVNVIALVGERGREVNEFIQRDLGPEGLARSIVVVATSDQPALVRVQAALAATALAEHFRDQGKHVLLIMDSLTRFAMAQREIGLAAGEPPATRGYPPSVFAQLPRLVERAGMTADGSITGFYSVLVEGDDTNEPISDAVRGLLDGHTVLSRTLASKGHYPAIDILASISRLMPAIADEQHLAAANTIRQLIAAYRDHEDLISIGAYRTGSDPTIDTAIAMKEAIDHFLQQGMNESSDLETSRAALLALSNQCRQTETQQTSAQ